MNQVSIIITIQHSLHPFIKLSFTISGTFNQVLRLPFLFCLLFSWLCMIATAAISSMLLVVFELRLLWNLLVIILQFSEPPFYPVPLPIFFGGSILSQASSKPMGIMTPYRQLSPAYPFMHPSPFRHEDIS